MIVRTPEEFRAAVARREWPVVIVHEPEPRPALEESFLAGAAIAAVVTAILYALLAFLPTPAGAAGIHWSPWSGTYRANPAYIPDAGPRAWYPQPFLPPPVVVEAPLPPAYLPAPPPAEPAGAPIHPVMHNGSVMNAITNPVGKTLAIVYLEPKPSLLGIGVTPGTLLIDGAWRGDEFFGTARVFDPQCGAMPYEVRGVALRDGTLVLKGLAPRVWAGSCVVSDYIWTHNSVLVFSQMGPPR